ncbi:non-homologous end-joining DNA ligase [Rugosimonospora africana]|nr:non-homologous end-joining DNA ligase [Rugosimonospora africana]
MLATAGPLPSGPGWAYEFKWDGVRVIATVERGTLRLRARSGAEVTAAYPELAPLGAVLDQAVLDGEIVVLDEDGRPSFTALAERMHVREAGRAARFAATRPVTYMIFDLLALDGLDLTGRSYADRRAALEDLDLSARRWLVPPRFDDGDATLAAADEYALEGVVAKRLSAPYRPGTRSPDWVKYKREHTADLVVGGWRRGARTIGALLVGTARPDGRLEFRGRVGGGISAAKERDLLAALRPLIVPSSPFASPLPREDARDAVWVRPQVVVEVRYGQVTADHRLRFPRLERLRTDKSPEECVDA